MIYKFGANIGDHPAGFESRQDLRTDIEREFSLLKQHNNESLDLQAARTAAAECINLGAMVELFHRTDNSDYDKVWEEDADPTYWPPEPINVFCPPKTIELALKLWALDAAVRVEVYFSMADLIKRYGERLVRIGDVLLFPYNAVGNISPKYFRITSAVPYGNYRFHWLYMQCICESIVGDITVLPPTEARSVDQVDEVNAKIY